MNKRYALVVSALTMISFITLALAQDDSPAVGIDAIRSALDQFDNGDAPVSLRRSMPTAALTIDEPRPMPRKRDPLAPVEPGLRLALGIGSLRGEYTAQSGGQYRAPNGQTASYRFPSGEQVSPQDVVTGKVRGEYLINPKWTIGASVMKNLTSDAGETESRSWGMFYRSGNPVAYSWSLDVLSKSETEIDVLISDAYLQYAFLTVDVLQASVRLGYHHNSQEIELSNARVSFPSSYSINPPQYVSGVWLRNDMTYSYPYLQLLGSMRMTKEFSMRAGMGGSPIARVKRTSTTVPSGDESVIDLTGTAILGFAEASYEFDNQWFVLAMFEGWVIEADGKEKMKAGGRNAGEWDSEMELSQRLFTVMVGKRF
jgi:hypothetical protein